MKKLLVLMLALVLLITAGCSTNEPPTVVEPETSNPEVDEPLEDDVKDETVIVDPETVRLTVSGYVRDDEGKGLPDYTVELHSEVKTTVTDKNGLFVFEDVEEGDHKLTVLDKNGKIMATYSLNLKADPSKNESSLTENNGSYSAVLSATLKLEMTVILGENGASSLNHGDYKPEPKPESKPEQKPENKPSAKPDDKKDEDKDKGHDVVIVKPGSGSTRPNRPTHTHTYKTEWSGDANYHWHDASCGHTNLVSDKAAHTVVNIPAKAATCSEKGYTEGTMCSVCKKVLSGCEETQMISHTEAVVEYKAPTCTVKGNEAGTKCSVCETVLSGCKEIDALGHTEVADAAVDATCTESGKTAGSHCSVCQVVLVAQETVNALGHDWGAWTKVPDEDKHQRTCSRACGENGAATVETVACSGTYTSKGTEGHTFKCETCSNTKDVAHTDSAEVVGSVWYETTKTCPDCGYVETITYKAGIGDKLYATIEAAIEIANDGETIKIAPGEFDAINLTGKTLNLEGSLNGTAPATTFEIKTAPSAQSDPGVWNGYKGTVKNIIFKAADGVANANTYGALTLNHVDWNVAADAEFENCHFINQGIKFYGDVDFKNCVFDGKNHVKNAFIYCIPTADITIEGCTVSGYTERSLQFAEPTTSVTVTVKGSNISGGKISIGAISKIAFESTALDCLVSAKSEGTAISFKGVTGENGFSLEKHANTIVENLGGNTGIAFDFCTDKDGNYCIDSAEGLKEFANLVNGESEIFQNKTVKLTANIDLSGENWTPINGWDGILNGTTIDGQNFTIKNMKVDGGDSAGFISNNASSITIKNITFDNAYVKTTDGNTKYAGVVMGKNYSVVTLENVKVTNSQVRCTWQCGGIVGYVGEDADIKNCTVSDSTISAGRDAGQVAGAAKAACVTGCSATNVTVTSNGTGTGANIREEVIGRVLG